MRTNGKQQTSISRLRLKNDDYLVRYLRLLVLHLIFDIYFLELASIVEKEVTL